MEELVIATNNQHKVEEIRRALGNKIKLISNFKELNSMSKIIKLLVLFQ